MTEKINIEFIEKSIANLVNQAGCLIYEISLKKSGNKTVLEIIIDKDGGVTIDDCENVTKLIDPALDKEESINGKYDYLAVSSVGIDKAFKTTNDFVSSVGNKIELKLYSAVENLKFFSSELVEANDEYVIIKYKNKKIRILRSNIIKANIAIEF